MADPQLTGPPPVPDAGTPDSRPVIHFSQFAAAIRKAHPDLARADISDGDLAHAFLTKYPETKHHVNVIDPLETGGNPIPTPPLTGYTGTKPPVAPTPPDVGLLAPARRAIAALVKPVREGSLTPAADIGLTGPIESAKQVVSGIAKVGAPFQTDPTTGRPVGAKRPAETLAEATADVAEGLMGAMAPPMLATGFAEAPLKTAIGLITGELAHRGTAAAGEAAGAPPQATRLLAAGAGLTAGTLGFLTPDVVRGGIDTLRAGAEARHQERLAPIYDQLTAEDQAFQADTAREAAMAATSTILQQQRAHAVLLAAKEAHAAGAPPGPFDYLDTIGQLVESLPAAEAAAAQAMTLPSPEMINSFRNVGRVEPPPAPLALPPARAGMIGAAEGAQVEPVGEFAPTVVQSTPPPIEDANALIRTIGAQLESTLTNTPPPYVDLGDRLVPQTMRPSPATRVKLADRQGYRDTYRSVTADLADEMDGMPHQRGKRVDDSETNQTYYTPPVAGSEIYWQIVGREGKSAPPRRMITDILRLFHETNGARSERELVGHPAYERIRQNYMGSGEKQVYGPRELKNAYMRYLPEMQSIADVRTRQKLAQVERNRAVDAGPIEPPQELAEPDWVTEETGPEDVPGGWEDGEVGAPTTGAPPVVGELRGVRPEEGTPGGAPPEVPGSIQGAGGTAEPPLPGLESVLSTENPTPPRAEAPFALSPPPGAEGAAAAPAGGSPTAPGRLPLLDRLTDETGALTLPPYDAAKLKSWLSRAAARYRDESWHDAASQALEEGDLTSAWRIASIAAVRTAGSEARAKQEEAGTVGAPGARQAVAEETQTQVARAKAAQRKQVEAELGHPLPPTVDITPEGILSFDLGGKGVPAVKARATDLTLAQTFLGDLTATADPSAIVYMGPDAESPLRVNAQIADQIVREMDPNVLADTLELTGIEDPVELGRQYRRAYSLMGKGLGALGRWTQDNMDVFYHYNAVGETGAAGERGSVGALQASGVLTPEGFVKWLGGKASDAELSELGFSLPKGIELKKPNGELTPTAKTFARNWFRRQQRKFETQQTIDRLAQGGSSIDKAVVRSTIAPELRSGQGGTFSQLMNLSRAFLIAKPSTMIRNTWSQGMRYTSDILDDTLAGVFSLGTGEYAQARDHFIEAGELAKAPFTKGTADSIGLLKRPWADGLEATYNYKADQIAGMGPDQVQKYLGLLQSFPEWEATYLGSLSLDVDSASGGSRYGWLNKLTSPEVRNTVTVLNRIQEHGYRASAFVGTFRAQLKQAGLDPAVEFAAGQDPNLLIQKLGADQVERMIGGSVAAALDKTFASNPYPGTVPDLLLDIFARHPITAPLLQLGFPFPRFNFVSAPRWLWDHFTLAPLVDLSLYGLSAVRSDASPMMRGRYYLMKQQQANADILASLDGEIGTTEYDAAKFLGNFMQAKSDARQSATSWKGLEARAAKNEPLHEIHGALVEAGSKMHESIQAAEIAKAKWREAEARITNLKGQRETAQATTTNLQMVGAARSPQEYWARIATGTAMLGAAYTLLSSKKDPAATRWYEYPVEDLLGLMGVDPKDEGVAKYIPTDRTIDLRAYAPQVQPFLLADVLLDLREHTDWSAFADSVKEAGGVGGHFWSEFFRDHYDGKYTQAEFQKDMLEAYLSVSPAAGSTKNIIDTLTGRTAQGEPVDAGALQDLLIAQVGEFAARFTAPLGAVTDILGQFNQEEAKARIPEVGEPDKRSAVRSLVDPTMAHIPGLREQIPEKISPITGQAVATVDPLARALGGVTERVRNGITEEMTRIGLPYGAAIPKQSGDREYDNYVAERYAKALQEIWPEVVNDPDYQAAPPTIRKEKYLIPVFRGLKLGAAAEGYDFLVRKLVGAGADATEAEVDARVRQMSPAARQRQKVLRKYYEAEEKANPQPDPEPPPPPL